MEQIDKIFALGHNGNIVNISELRRKLESRGAIFQTTTDSELIAHLVLHKKGPLEERLVKVFDELKGAWSLVMLTPEAVLAARDPYGFRPLCIGRKGDAIIFASETCALDIIDAEYVRDVAPGEIVIADHNGLRSVQGPRRSHSAMCVFEYIYFSRPDSMIFEHGVYGVRKQLGLQLALESPVEGADLVVPCPLPEITLHSVTLKAAGYLRIRRHKKSLRGPNIHPAVFRCAESGCAFETESGQGDTPGQEGGSDRRFNSEGHHQQAANQDASGCGRSRDSHEDKLSTYSLPCFYGVDFSSKGELIACSNTVEQICDFIGADSLAYLSLEGMFRAMPCLRRSFARRASPENTR